METKQTMTYEQAMKRLEEIASLLEKEQVELDQVADMLKEAEKLLAFCRQNLYDAEQKCQKILSQSEEA